MATTPPELVARRWSGPMQVGPRGEGEREILVRLLGGLVGAGLGVALVAGMATNFGVGPTLRDLSAVYVGLVLAAVFLPELVTLFRKGNR